MLLPSEPLGDVLVLGLGRSGCAVARYLCELMDAQAGLEAPLVSSLTIYAGASSPERLSDAEEFLARGIPVIFDTEEVEGSYDLCVASPGIPPMSTFHTCAARVSSEVIAEPEFAFRISPERWVGITGTNGKSTTTELLAHLLTEAGHPARVAGNIGDPCTHVMAERGEDEYLSVELSSCQLAFVKQLAPMAAILLNITPDHITWHGSFEAYADAKLKLFEHMVPDAPIAIDATAPNTRGIYKRLRDEGRFVIPLGTAEGIEGDMVTRCGAHNAAYVDAARDGLLTVCLDGRTFELVTTAELPIKGEHNQENALAAAAICLALGADAEDLRRGLRSFKALEHRIEPCGSGKGLSFFNDSKATNPEAVLKALTAFEDKPVHILLGGTDKGTDLGELVARCLATCSTVVCYGASRERFLKAFQAGIVATQSSCALLKAEHMSDALEVALATAQPGGVILLSPACASFDEFDSFEHRGRVFKELVHAYLGGGRCD